LEVLRSVASVFVRLLESSTAAPFSHGNLRCFSLQGTRIYCFPLYLHIIQSTRIFLARKSLPKYTVSMHQVNDDRSLVVPKYLMQHAALTIVQFVTIEFDGHEGDWQSVRVLVCDSALTSIENEAQSSPTVPTPLAVSYGKANNAWLQTMDCTTGQCIFFKDTYHPVGFVSLGDHSVYPQSTRNIVLYRFESNFILSLQGVYAVSHTLFRDDNGRVRYFAPNMTNVVRYKEPDEISIFTTSEEDYWQAFGG